MTAQSLPVDPVVTALEALCKDGTLSFAAIEKKAELGNGVLSLARKKGTQLQLEVLLKISTAIEIPLRDLVAGDDPRLALLSSAGIGGDGDRRQFRIAWDRLVQSGFNSRQTYDDETIAELALSIAAEGLLQPLLVRPAKGRPGMQEVVDGERRRRAISLLALRRDLPDDLATLGIPVFLTDVGDAEALAQSLLANFHRVAANPMEEAEAFARLQALDKKAWSSERIAERLGMSKRHVQGRLRLAHDLTEAAKSALREGKINPTQARALATAPQDAQATMLDNLANEDMGEEEVLDLAAAYQAAEMLGPDTVCEFSGMGLCQFKAVERVSNYGCRADWLLLNHDGTVSPIIRYRTVTVKNGKLWDVLGDGGEISPLSKAQITAALARYKKADSGAIDDVGADDDLMDDDPSPSRQQSSGMNWQERTVLVDGWCDQAIVTLSGGSQRQTAMAFILADLHEAQGGECFAPEFFEPAGPMASFADLCERDEDTGKLQLTGDATAEAVFERLLRLPEGVLFEIWLGIELRFRVSLGYGAARPLRRSLARVIGLPIPRELLPDQTELEDAIAETGE